MLWTVSCYLIIDISSYITVNIIISFIVNYNHKEVLLTIGDINLYGKAIMDMATFQDLDHQVQH